MNSSMRMRLYMLDKLNKINTCAHVCCVCVSSEKSPPQLQYVSAITHPIHIMIYHVQVSVQTNQHNDTLFCNILRTTQKPSLFESERLFFISLFVVWIFVRACDTQKKIDPMYYNIPLQWVATLVKTLRNIRAGIKWTSSIMRRPHSRLWILSMTYSKLNDI